MNRTQTPKVVFSTTLLVLVSIISIFIVVEKGEKKTSYDENCKGTVAEETYCKKSSSQHLW